MTMPSPSRSIKALAAVVISSALNDCQGDTAVVEGVVCGVPSAEQAASNDSIIKSDASFIGLLDAVILGLRYSFYYFEHYLSHGLSHYFIA